MIAASLMPSQAAMASSRASAANAALAYFRPIIVSGGLTMDCRFIWRRVLMRSAMGTPLPSDVSDSEIRYSTQLSVAGTKLFVVWR